MNSNHNTVHQVVEGIIDELPLDARVSTANLDENEFRVLELALGKYIRYRLDQMDVVVKEELKKDCLAISKDMQNDVDAAKVILKLLWDRLRETHRIRVVK